MTDSWTISSNFGRARLLPSPNFLSDRGSAGASPYLLQSGPGAGGKLPDQLWIPVYSGAGDRVDLAHERQPAVEGNVAPRHLRHCRQVGLPKAVLPLLTVRR